MNTEAVIKSIQIAFSDVVLGEGIGLWEAQAIDDYESEITQKNKRAKDEKNNWSVFTCAELQRCHSSLSFFDADGMRFHLPAFMIGSLNKEVDDPIFYLTHLDDYSQSKFTSLNKVQILAIINYLKWCLNKDEFEFERFAITKAINEYWCKKI